MKGNKRNQPNKSSSKSDNKGTLEKFGLKPEEVP